MGKDKRKPLVELSEPGGNVIMYWPSAKDAANYYGINQVNISYNANGICHQAKGHYFRFATPEETNQYRLLYEFLNKIPNKPAPKPVEVIEIPAENIEAPDETTANPDGELSFFEKMLQKSKNNFNSNSE